MIDLARVKSHLRIDDDEEDTFLAVLIHVAKGYLERIGCDVSTEPVPPPLEMAALLLIGHWYQNRECTGKAAPSINFGVAALTLPYRTITL
jgi:hypothetical protein